MSMFALPATSLYVFCGFVLAPYCRVTSPADTSSQWRDKLQSVSVANKDLISDPTLWLPGFNRSRLAQSMLNRSY